MGQRATKSVLKRYKGRGPQTPRAGKPTPQRQIRRYPASCSTAQSLQRPREDRGRRAAFTVGGTRENLVATLR